MQWKKVLSGWINNSKDGGSRQYLRIQNVSDQDIVIKPGESIFMNKADSAEKFNHPNRPDFWKSVPENDDVNLKNRDIEVPL